jgi:ubiquinone/menaquinone biosynthesis C-methylase UbiE
VQFYWNVVFPRLCDVVMRGPEFGQQRHSLLRQVSGEILEIGVGSGLNLEHYPKNVRRISTIDPSVGMSKLLSRRIADSGMDVDHHVRPAEAIDFQDATFDCVVSTWTLCSVTDVARVVAELYRVLKPGGRFVFLEHGLSDNPSVQKWQRRLNWLQRIVAGCRLDLNVRELLIHQPFASVEINNFIFERALETHGTMYRGVATK